MPRYYELRDSKEQVSELTNHLQLLEGAEKERVDAALEQKEPDIR